jgi:Kef-type K+ transport system membrane component KefB/Trk K+ transport system NAD-binding subunit
MEPSTTFLPLLLVLLLAFIIPPLIARARWLPSVVGQIIAGLIVGRSGFKLIQADVTLEFLAEVGLAFLMFLSGLEIDFTMLFPAQGKSRKKFLPLAVGIASFGVTLVLALALSFFVTQRGWSGDPWMLALILSTTSLGVVLPVLKERNLSSGAFGQNVLLGALLADFLTMFFITIYVAVRSTGLSLNILVVGVLFVAALLVYRLGLVRMRLLRKSHFLEDISASPSPQTKVHGAVALLVGFVILTQFLGTEMILGAFLAGAVLSLLNPTGYEPVRHRLEGIGFGFFVPVFFIAVGIRFDLVALVRDPKALLFAGIFLAAAFAIKIFPSLLYRFLFGWKETFAAGFLLSARLSLIIAAAGIGLRLGAIDETAHGAFILIAAASSTIAPMAFNAVLPHRRRRKEDRICILGISSLGLNAARELKDHDEKVLFIESDRQQARSAKESGFEVVVADDPLAELEKLDRETTKAVLVLSSDDARNLEIGRKASALGFKRVIALANRPNKRHDTQKPDVLTFSPSLYQTTLLAVMVSNPDLFSLLTSPKEGQLAREIHVNNPTVAGHRLRELRFGGNVLVLNIHREDQALIPSGNTRIEMGDVLTVVGERKALREIADWLEWR